MESVFFFIREGFTSVVCCKLHAGCVSYVQAHMSGAQKMSDCCQETD